MSALSSKLRELVNEPAADSEYTDGDLDAILAEYSDDLNKAATAVWLMKAAKFADLVNITEGSSSRSWSGAYKQALEMSKVFEKIADDDTPGAGGPTARSRKIIRS